MRLTKEQLKEFIADETIEDATIEEDYERLLKEEEEHEEMLRLLGIKKRRKIEYNYEFDPFDFEGKSKPLTEEDREKEKLRGIAELFDTSDDCRTKVIEYGDTVEVITSYNRADGKGFKKIKNLPGNQYKDLETGEIHLKQKKEKRKDSPYSFKNSVKELERLIELNFVGSNGYFITLAYECYISKADTVQKDFEKFYSKFLYYYGRRTKTKLIFLRVLEPSKEIVGNGWHIHLLVKSEDGNDLKITKEQVAKIWGDNKVSVCPIAQSAIGSNNITYGDESSISILCNTDTLMSYYNSSTKLYTCSQNIKRPVVSKMTRKEMKEKMTGYNRKEDYITRFNKKKKKRSYLINAVRYETYKKSQN